MLRILSRDTDAYRALCARYAVPVFHQPWWLDATCAGWRGIVSEGGSFAGIWPVPLERKLGVWMSRNPALTPYLGPVILPAGPSTRLNSEETRARILNDLLEQLPSVPVWSTTAAPGIWSPEEFSGSGFAVGSRPTYLIALLNKTEEQLFSALAPEVRRSVRRTNEQALIADEPHAAEEMYALQRATHQRKGARFVHSAAYFMHLVQDAKARGQGALWTARRGDGTLLGAQWSIWDDRCCYNIGLARNERAGDKFATSALLWQAIRHAHSLGLEIFDFEGSSIPSIADFFSRFGGTVQPYLTLQKNSSPVWRMVRRLRA